MAFKQKGNHEDAIFMDALLVKQGHKPRGYQDEFGNTFIQAKHMWSPEIIEKEGLDPEKFMNVGGGVKGGRPFAGMFQNQRPSFFGMDYSVDMAGNAQSITGEYRDVEGLFNNPELQKHAVSQEGAREFENALTISSEDEIRSETSRAVEFSYTAGENELDRLEN